MKIELTQYEENEDGGANCHVDLDKEAARSLINYALINMLSKAAEEGKLYTPEFNEAEAEEEEEDLNYFYDEEEDVEYYYVEDEGIWYCYDEDEDDWFVVDDGEEDEEEDEEEYEEDEDDETWVALDPDQLDLLFVRELKKCLTNSYQNNLFFQEDIDDNIHVRNACKTLLKYFMIPNEADDYIDKIATIYEC
jgi:hypothetical protein